MVDKLAVPALLEAVVAVKELMFAAFTVAPELTTKTSLSPPAPELSPPNKVIMSVPESTLKVSLPVPPTRVSFPAPPVIMSSAFPPVRLSTPAPPEIVNPSV